jgi:hypothetical protein
MLLGSVLCESEKHSGSSSKQTYTIGGWNQRGDSEKFLREWTPLLSDYLSAAVGSLYNPPISFQLIPIDWDENETAEVLISQDKLDFICELFDHPSCCVIILHCCLS